jgi:hypothetical protein
VKLSAFSVCFLVIVALSLHAGCASSVSARKVVPLDRYHRIYVETRLNENNHLDEVFVAELRRLGREASAGPLTMMPEKTDAVLTYDARWEWDFRTYLIELNFELHTVHPRKKLADARYHQPTIKTKAPDDVINTLLTRLFTKS